MKKIYRALAAHVVEKKWVGDNDKAPDGWYDSPQVAMENWNKPKVVVAEPKAKRGK